MILHSRRSFLLSTSECNSSTNDIMVSIRKVSYYYDRYHKEIILYSGLNSAILEKYLRNDTISNTQNDSYTIFIKNQNIYSYSNNNKYWKIIKEININSRIYKIINIINKDTSKNINIILNSLNNIPFLSYFYSYKGRRKSNEDSIAYASIDFCTDNNTYKYRILAMADGAGGLGGGDLASSTGIQTVIDKLLASIVENSGKLDYKSLEDAVIGANERVKELAFKINKFIATTLSLVVIDLTKQEVYYTNVGDTKILLLDNNRLLKELSNMYRVQLDRGSALTTYLGMDKITDLKINKIKLNSMYNHYIILMTDGVYEYISEDQLSNYIFNNNIVDAAKNIITYSYYNGSTDNLSILIFKIGEVNE